MQKCISPILHLCWASILIPRRFHCFSVSLDSNRGIPILFLSIQPYSLFLCYLPPFFTLSSLPYLSPLLHLSSRIAFLSLNPQPLPYQSPLVIPVVDRAETLVFSYDVLWERSDVEWGSRWDAYLSADAPNEKVSQPR